MSLPKDAAETEGLGGAELSVLPDGSLSVILDAPGGLLRGRFLGDFAPAAVLLAGDARFSPALGAVAERMAARGIGVLTLTWRGGVPRPAALDAAAAFLRGRGVRRFALAACAEAADWALSTAAAPDVFGLALLSPEAAGSAAEGGFRACPAVVLCGEDDEAARALAKRMRHAELVRFAKAAPDLSPVAADLSALVVERFARALAPDAAP